MGLKMALLAGAVGLGGALMVGAVAVGKLKSLPVDTEPDKLIHNTYVVAAVLSLVAALVVGGTVFGLGSGLASRITDLTLAVSKMGRGTKAAVRVTGNDELTLLGRTLSALSAEMAGQGEAEDGSAAVDRDPQIRELRDKTLATGAPPGIAGFEIDASLSAGSRGGLDYFDCHADEGRVVLFLIGCGSNSAASVLAARMARDELIRALGTGATVRKAMAHTNRVLHRALPRGVCALATVVEVSGEEAKIYQAGARVPVLLCSAGALEDLTAEGLALGLDSGPVFENGLRPNTVAMAKGMRLVVLNDAANRNEDLVASVQQHSPKHTSAFMNMVLGELEQAAGGDGLREDAVVLTVKRS